MLRTYLILGAAVAAEVVATTALARSDGLTRLTETIVTIVFYGIAFWLLSLTLRVMPTGVVYAIWSGLGIVLITAVAWIWMKQSLDFAALIGLALIIAGVIVINVFSRSLTH